MFWDLIVFCQHRNGDFYLTWGSPNVQTRDFEWKQKSTRNIFFQGQGNFEFHFEVTIYEDSQARELDFNVAAGFTNKLLIKTLGIINKTKWYGFYEIVWREFKLAAFHWMGLLIVRENCFIH